MKQFFPPSGRPQSAAVCAAGGSSAVRRAAGAIAVLLGLLCVQTAAQEDPLAAPRAARDELIHAFQVTGTRHLERLAPAAADLEAIASRSSGEQRARALLDLGTVRRLQNDFAGALAAYQEAAAAADGLGLTEVAFDARIGIARSSVLGAADHAAAAAAFEAAAEIAGASPTPRQRFTLASYQTQLVLARGEADRGLLDALQSLRVAPDAGDRFYAKLDIADALQKKVESCDYQPLTDVRSADDETDPYAACRRAVRAAQGMYDEAAATADALGWRFLADQAETFRRMLDARLAAIEQRAGQAAELARHPEWFQPRDADNVLANRQFASRARDPATAAAIEQVVSQWYATLGWYTARANFMLGLATELRDGRPEDGLPFFTAAARQLAAERRGFFDPRHRGTMIEDRAEFLPELALRLLALGREAEAFDAFEAVRARGLSELAAALGRSNITSADRSWLADLLRLEAEASDIETGIVGRIVATGKTEAEQRDLAMLETLRTRQRQLLQTNEQARARLAGPDTPVTLPALNEAARRTGVAVLLYWTTTTNVVAWYVGPHGSEVRTVFLPASVTAEKARHVLKSASSQSGELPLDTAAARELFLFLLAPFASLLDAQQLLIIPQGPLVELPFEVLIDPATGQPAVERWAISYAPNATMALRALQRAPQRVTRVTALVDPDINDNTHEIGKIVEAGVAVEGVAREDLTQALSAGGSLHILTHGQFHDTEPLLSKLVDPAAPRHPILATDLIGWPVRGLPLAVLSACEGGRVGLRISNEIFGFPWALLAGGAEATVLSRWLVDGTSNGQWMRAFYGEAAKGASPAQAAAAAMRQMRRAGFEHPYYWAAMQVTGR
jgi:CHAT domain-containing protein